MNCENCGTEIHSKMKGAIRSNTCPYCAGEIMPKLKAEQYLNLLDVLEATTFTTRAEVDSQIREKVANLLISNFVFKKLESPVRQPDLINVDEDIIASTSHIAKVAPVSTQTTITAKLDPVDTSVYEGQVYKTSNNTNVQTSVLAESTTQQFNKITQTSSVDKSDKLDKSPARQLKRNKKTNYKDFKKEVSILDTINDVNNDDGDFDYESSDDFNDLTPDEIKRFFPQLSTNEITNIASTQLKGSGKGIKRV